MKNRKLNLDRAPLNPEQVRSKMNFSQILDSYKTVKPTIWKSPWFYGPAGLATIAIAVSLSLTAFQKTQNTAYDQTATLTTEALPKDTECIHPPLVSDLAFEEHAFNPGKDTRIVLAGGTEVHLPAGSIRTTAEEAILKTREFYNKTDVFLSGVKMDIGSQAFESAGMIEIRVTDRAGRELQVNPDRPLFVSMPVNTADSAFRFWQLDEEKGAWKDYPVEFVRQPVASQSASTGLRDELRETTCALADVHTKENALQKPQKADYKLPEDGRQRFDLDFSERQYPELSKLKNVEFEVCETRSYDHDFAQKTWSAVKLHRDGTNRYVAAFFRKGEQFAVHVRPVLTGAERAAAEKEFDEIYKSYLEEKQSLEAQKAQLERTEQELRLRIENQSRELAAIYRAKTATVTQRADFYITSFGFYNCDKKVNYPPPFVRQPVMAREDTGERIDASRVFVFDRRRNLRYNFGDRAMRPLSVFGLKQNSENLVLVVDAQNQVGILQIDSREEIPQKLVFRMIGDTKLSPETIRKYLEGEKAAV